MPRYHFDIHDGQDILDDEGTELADLQAARTMAVRVAGDCLRDHAETFWNGHEWRMDVTDDQRLVLFTLTFHAMDAANVAPSR